MYSYQIIFSNHSILIIQILIFISAGGRVQHITKDFLSCIFSSLMYHSHSVLDVFQVPVICLFLQLQPSIVRSEEPTSFGSLFGKIFQQRREQKSSLSLKNKIKLRASLLPQIGGVDFRNASSSEDGRLCVFKNDTISTLSKEPILDCSHSTVEKCHLTYVTNFISSQEEMCSEIFEKTCQITFRKEISRETVMKCITPLETVCNGQGPEECKTFTQSSCTTRYKEDTAGEFVADTRCEKIPREICGEGCIVEEAPEECHDKIINILIDVPEEVCDLTPQETCHMVTKLVPRLRPIKECTMVPKEVCHLRFSQPRFVEKPLRTEWCREDNTIDNDSLDPDYGLQDDVDDSLEPGDIFQDDVISAIPPSSSYSAESAAAPPSSSYSAKKSADLVRSLRRLRSAGIAI